MPIFLAHFFSPQRGENGNVLSLSLRRAQLGLAVARPTTGPPLETRGARQSLRSHLPAGSPSASGRRRNKRPAYRARMGPLRAREECAACRIVTLPARLIGGGAGGGASGASGATPQVADCRRRSSYRQLCLLVGLSARRAKCRSGAATTTVRRLNFSPPHTRTPTSLLRSARLGAAPRVQYGEGRKRSRRQTADKTGVLFVQ